ncbi:MAG: VWA domain-containing protein [Vicinamibacterales bacterium]
MTNPATFVRHVVVPIALLALVLPVAAQNPPSENAPQVFRSRVNFVRVDAYPRRDGRIVEGLTAADFRIKEDGRLQTVETFEFVRHVPGDDRHDPRNKDEADRWVADPERRVLVIYFDLYHTTRASGIELREQVMTTLAKAIGPTDVIALMTNETPLGSLAFTQTLGTLNTEIARYWAGGLLPPDESMSSLVQVQPRNPAEVRLAACGGRDGYGRLLMRFRDIVTFTSLESLIAVVGSLRHERTHVVFLSEGWANPRGGVSPQRLRSIIGGAPMPPGRDVQFGTPPSDVGERRPPTCREQLLRLEAFDHDARFRALFRLANAANVSFHTIDVGGLRTGMNLESGQITLERPVGVKTLLELADNTDGLSTVSSNDITSGLTRVFERTSSYYLLGYYSTNAATDGKYREIEVEVVPRGIGVTARRGYTAVSPRQQQRSDERAASVAVPEPVATALGPLTKWQAAADDEVLGAGTATSTAVTVVAEIGRRSFESGRWRAGASVGVDLVDATGRSQRAEGHIAPGARSALVEIPMSGESRGPWRATIRVSDQAGDVSTRIDVAPAPLSTFGAARLFRRVSAGRALFAPTAAPFFMRTERLRAEWAVAATSRAPTVRLLDRRGQPLAPGAAMLIPPDPPAGVLAVELYIAALSEGDYVLELAVPDGPRELTPFRVVR